MLLLTYVPTVEESSARGERTRVHHITTKATRKKDARKREHDRNGIECSGAEIENGLVVKILFLSIVDLTSILRGVGLSPGRSRVSQHFPGREHSRRKS